MCAISTDGTTEMGWRRVLGVLDIRGVWGVVWFEGVKTEGNPHMGMLTNKVVCTPTIIVGRVNKPMWGR